MQDDGDDGRKLKAETDAWVRTVLLTGLFE